MLVVMVLQFEQPDINEITGYPKVVDGDSLIIGDHRIRLEGIDAPEMKQQCDKDGQTWSCGVAAKEALNVLLADQQIKCTISGKDKYRRQLARCEVAGRDVGQWMVVNGHAASYGAYELDQTLAQRNNLGIWQGPFEHPSDWRRRSNVVEVEFDLVSWLYSMFR